MSFPVDTVNRSLLFTAFLEKEGKINRSQIIRFLMDHARKMEHTWDNMQVLVVNISLASGPQPEPKTPARRKSPDLFRTPEAGGPSETKTGPDASPDDMVSTPDFVSPLTVGNFPPVLANILSPVKIPLPEVAGPSGAHSPSPTRRRFTDPLSRGVRQTPRSEASPSLREMPDSGESNETSPVKYEPRYGEEIPSSTSSGKRRKEVETPSPEGLGPGHVEESPLKRSLRNKGVKKTP